MLIDIRAREIARLRRSQRELSALLQEIEKNADLNDRILLSLHKVALLLISKPANWQTQLVALLKKEFALPYCRLLIFSPTVKSAKSTSSDKKMLASTAAFAKQIARLPAGGKAFDAALANGEVFRGAKRYFYLPLKNERRTKGVLILASRQAAAFPDEAAHDFSRRLAALLSAAL